MSSEKQMQVTERKCLTHLFTLISPNKPTMLCNKIYIDTVTPVMLIRYKTNVNIIFCV